VRGAESALADHLSQCLAQLLVLPVIDRASISEGAVPPIMLKKKANPGGLPVEVFDGFRAAYLADRAQFFLDVASGPFFGFN
jgi:hypothetical protein